MSDHPAHVLSYQPWAKKSLSTTSRPVKRPRYARSPPTTRAPPRVAVSSLPSAHGTSSSFRRIDLRKHATSVNSEYSDLACQLADLFASTRYQSRFLDPTIRCDSGAYVPGHTAGNCYFCSVLLWCSTQTQMLTSICFTDGFGCRSSPSTRLHRRVPSKTRK